MYTNKTHKLTLADKQYKWHRLRQLAAKTHETTQLLSSKNNPLKIVSQETSKTVPQETNKAA